MSEKGAADIRFALEPGWAVSISPLEKTCAELAASVVTNLPDEVWVKLPRPTVPLPFRIGDQVRIKYWDGKAVVYCWVATVVKIAGTNGQHVAMSIRDTGVTLQRRKSVRLRVSIPFSLTVTRATQIPLIGENVADALTQDIAVGGLSFETNLPLVENDKLEMNLHFTESQSVNALGWVVRSEPVEGNGEGLSLVGVEFLQLDERDQVELLEFLASHITDGYLDDLELFVDPAGNAG